MRKIKFENGEYYHIYNRGTDKRNIFSDKNDLWRFIKGILIFNRVNPVGSIRDELGSESPRDRVPVDYEELVKLSGGLVEIVSFCLNPNHYHVLVRQISDGGVSKFMHKLGSGYTSYFNDKKDRSGVLFQGKFKAVHIESNEQLLYTSAYVGLNDKVHNIKDEDRELVFSSWREYLGENKKLNICGGKSVILDQFSSIEDYKEFAVGVVETSRGLKKERGKSGDFE